VNTAVDAPMGKLSFIRPHELPESSTESIPSQNKREQRPHERQKHVDKLGMTSRWSWQEGIEECGKHHALDHHEVVVESQSVPPKLLAPVPGIHHRLFRITGLRLPMNKIKLRKVEFALAEMTG